MGVKTFTLGGNFAGQVVSTNTFLTLGGQSNLGASEAVCEEQAPFAITAKNFGVNVQTNTVSATATGFYFRKNVGNGNQVVLPKSAGTGWLSDATHTDSLVANDNYDINYSPAGGETGNCNLRTMGCEFDASAAIYVNASPGTPSNYSGTANYGPPMGAGQNTTEAGIQQFKVATAGVLANLTVTSASAVGATVLSRKNTANGTQTVSPSGTGFVTDSTHTDSVVATDLVNFKTTGTSGSWSAIAFSFTPSAGNAELSSVPFQSENTSTTYFAGFGGANTAPTTEAQTQAALPFAATGSNLRAYNNNTSGCTVACTFRKGAADGTQTFTLSSGVAAGWTTDATHTDSIAAGALIDMKMVTGTGSSTTMTFVTETLSAPSANKASGFFHAFP